MTYFKFKNWGDADFEEALQLGIQDEYAFKEWPPEDLNLPREYEDIRLDMVEEVSDIKKVDVRLLPDDRRLVRAEAHLVCNFEVFIFKPNYFLVDDDPRLSVTDHDWNKHYMRGEVTLSLQGIIRLILDKSDSEQSKIEVLSVQPIIPEDERLDRVYYPKYHPMRRRFSRPSR